MGWGKGGGGWGGGEGGKGGVRGGGACACNICAKGSAEQREELEGERGAIDGG